MCLLLNKVWFHNSCDVLIEKEKTVPKDWSRGKRSKTRTGRGKTSMITSESSKQLSLQL